MTSFRLAGFRAVRVTSFWRPGLTEPERRRARRTLRNVADAATRNGVRVYVTVMSPDRRRRRSPTRRAATSRPTPPRSYARRPSIEHVIVGNEPNLNRFWLPQFALDGSSAAPPRTSRCSSERTTP